MKTTFKIIFPMKLTICTLVAVWMSVQVSVGQSFKAKDNLLGVNAIGGYSRGDGFVGSLPLFYEYGTPWLGERVGIGGYSNLYLGAGQRNDLTLGGRIALHPFKAERWDVYISTGVGYGFSLTGPSSDAGFRLDPLFGARYYISKPVGLELVAGRYGREGLQIGLGINTKF